MTYIKLIFFIIMIMLDRCGIITPISRKDVISVETEKLADTSLNGTWRLTGLSQGDSAETGRADSISKKENPAEVDLLLSFFPDRTFTEIKGNGEYQTGKFAYSDARRSLSLTYTGKEEIFQISFDFASNGSRMIILHSPSGNKLSLTGSGRNLENYKEDPFYSANNVWRIKPSEPESPEQILNRLAGYINHNALILKAADTRRQEYVSWEFSKGIIKIYHGGIGIVAADQIPPVWINSFHSRNDALKAHKMFENHLLRTAYKGTATGNWVRDDYQILISIYAGLKKPV